MPKRYTAAEIETARDYIGGHADALPRTPSDAERMIAEGDAATDRMLARMQAKEDKQAAALARRAAKAAK